MPHAKRPALKAREPIHITMRVVDVIGRLRTRSAYMAIREAAIAVFRREDFRIVHLSIEGTHIHLLVEADHREALSNGMRAFEGSAAKHLNAACLEGGQLVGAQARGAARARAAGAPQGARVHGPLSRDGDHARRSRRGTRSRTC